MMYFFIDICFVSFFSNSASFVKKTGTPPEVNVSRLASASFAGKSSFRRSAAKSCADGSWILKGDLWMVREPKTGDEKWLNKLFAS